MGVTLAVSKLLRTDAMIVLIAVFCYLFYMFTALEKDETGNKKKCRVIIMGIMIIAAYAAVLRIAEFAVQKQVGMEIANRCPLWELVCGMTPQNYGRYDTTYSWIIAVPAEEQWSVAKGILREIFTQRSIGETFLFFYYKIYFMWGAEDFSNGIAINTAWGTCMVWTAVLLDKLAYLLLILLAYRNLHRDPEWSEPMVLTAISFLGYFCSYLLIESGARYRYCTVFMLVLMAGYMTETPKLDGIGENHVRDCRIDRF